MRGRHVDFIKSCLDQQHLFFRPCTHFLGLREEDAPRRGRPMEQLRHSGEARRMRGIEVYGATCVTLLESLTRAPRTQTLVIALRLHYTLRLVGGDKGNARSLAQCSHAMHSLFTQRSRGYRLPNLFWARSRAKALTTIKGRHASGNHRLRTV